MCVCVCSQDIPNHQTCFSFHIVLQPISHQSSKLTFPVIMATLQELYITDPAHLQAVSLPRKPSDSSLAHNTATPKKTTTQQTIAPPKTRPPPVAG